MQRRHLAPRSATRRGALVFGVLLAALCWCTGASSSFAKQVGLATRRVPSPEYYFVFGEFYDGDFVKAGRDYLREGRGAIKTAQSHWIDSICYHTMAGECYYQMGDLTSALQHYTSALDLYRAFSDWMIRVQFPPTIRPANAGQIFNCPWGRSTRNAVVGNYPDTMSIGQGQILTREKLQQGGVVQNPILYPVVVQEVVRCTTLAMRRRAELLGPSAPYDRLNNDVFAALSRRPGPGNHWGDTWIGVELGVAAAAIGKDPVARNELQASIVAAGQFDHPLTCIALYELGMLDLKQGGFASAANNFLEASISAGQYGDMQIIAEALRGGLTVHLVTNQKGLYPPLLPAATWANREGYLHLYAELMTLVAENYTAIGETGAAMDAIAQARRAVGRRAMASGRTGARLNFVNAQALYAQGSADQGARMLSTAMNYESKGSIWLFQLAMADDQYMKGEIQARVAMELYTQLLRDPQAGDWATEPMETMAVLVHPHGGVYENWFAAALERREPERAFEIADRIRRHRFLSTLEMGGRLTSLRWLLEGPAEDLDPQATLERQDLLTRYPNYNALHQQADALRQQLRALPPDTDDPDQQNAQAKLLSELAQVSLAQEQILRGIAVSRHPATTLFPPQRTLEQIQDSLPDGTALLSFLMTDRHGAHAFLTTKEKGKYEQWDIPNATSVQRKLTPLLRAFGNYEANTQVDVKTLSGDEWRKPAAEMFKLITTGCKTTLPGKFTELAIVPDGPLWYVPFEALPTGDKGDGEALLTSLRIRYAPTAGLAVPGRRPRAGKGATAVIAGKLYSRDDVEQTLATAEEIGKAIPGTAVYDAPPSAPSVVFRALFDRLIVLEDIPGIDRDYYAWSPMGQDKGNLGGSLGVWFGLPLASPDQVILPGFHTSAERALQKTTPANMGADVFLSLCGLMSSGTRTVLLSRWRTGGDTCYALMREFSQELPHDSAAAAWQRSVLLARDANVSSETEPRVKRGAGDTELTARHPFFWSGYMVVDPGLEPPKDADEAPLQQAANP